MADTRMTHLIGPKTGFEASTTTAFCTVERVMSCSLTMRSAVRICRLHLLTVLSASTEGGKQGTHDMPKSVVGLGELGTR